MKNFNQLAKEIHENARSKGFNSDGEPLIDILEHLVDEVYEVYEEFRTGHDVAEIYVKDGKPEGIPVELADIIIRILSYCGKESIDIESAIVAKMKYNTTRPYKHGGKI